MSSCRVTRVSFSDGYLPDVRINLSQVSLLEFQLVAASVLAFTMAALYMLGRRVSRRTGIPAWKSTLDQKERLIACAIMAGALELSFLLLLLVQ
jgi:hypothetical protein